MGGVKVMDLVMLYVPGVASRSDGRANSGPYFALRHPFEGNRAVGRLMLIYQDRPRWLYWTGPPPVERYRCADRLREKKWKSCSWLFILFTMWLLHDMLIGDVAS